MNLTAHLDDSSIDLEAEPTIRFMDPHLSDSQCRYAELGLNAVVDRYPNDALSLVGKVLMIDRVDYALTDFQDEGVACAVAAWVCEELGIKKSPLTLEFDGAQNRYLLKERAG